MLRNYKRLLHRGVKALDVMIVAGTIWTMSQVDPSATLMQAGIVGLAWILVSLRTNFYQSRRTASLMSEVFELAETWVISLAVGALAILTIWGSVGFPTLPVFGIVLAGIAIARVAIRIPLRALRGQGKNFRGVVIVGRGRMAQELCESVRDHSHYGIRILGSFHLRNEIGPAPNGVKCLGNAARFAKIISDLEVDSVVLCPDLRVSAADIQYILDKCDIAGIKCFYAPDFLHLNNLVAESSTFGGMPGFTFQPAMGSPFHLAIKRAMDIVGALIGIILTLPVMILVAIAIKLYDRGPLLFKQVRLGKDSRRFYCYKFRSMCVDAESRKESLLGMNEQDGPAFKLKEDPRVTPIGRTIRKYSIDEFPQLFNVLLGDMSLVGPRPPVPAEVARYSWWQRRRISVRPGLTCLWQVKGRNKVSFEKWMEMDLFYIDNWSLWMDIKLMAQTMPAVMRGTGS